jgi:NADH:ubiquinone oxidoreductase subunit 5 (subunit L)/multisubunit Na+/H+ antiporter MnhA subunit
MLITVICICLFIGAMGKSAQFPLHVWLPDSMEGPTPISALIHAATMVTAGIFMVARMSPLFELSDTALNFVLVIGSITALFMGFLGIIQNDIKRVVAYSTLSQLGYMTVALGVSAYSVAVFHLMTHAFFKALLFLGAGSVIIGMHHDQDIRNMGGLRKYMPITWITSLLGPGADRHAVLRGLLLEGQHHRGGALQQPAGRGLRDFAVTLGVFVTAFYSFRMYFLVFHGEERFRHKPFPGEHDHADDHGHVHAHEPHESPWVVTLPLVLLAIPSVVIGYLTIQPMLYGDFFKDASSSTQPATRRWPRLREHVPRRRGDGDARFEHAAVLAGAGRRGDGLGVLPEGAGHPGRNRPRASSAARAREQVLHGLVQRERAGGAPRGSAPGCGRAATRALIDGADQRLGAHGRACMAGAGAAGADRPPVLVCAGDGAGHLRLLTWQLWPYLQA